MLHARNDYDRIQDPAGKIADDEPVFLLRAKDALAPGILMKWATELINRGGDKKMAKMVADHALLMIDWQEKNGCKMPDLPLPSDKPIGICSNDKCNEPEVNCGLCKEHYPGFANNFRP